MTGVVRFEKLNVFWQESNGAYDILFSGIYHPHLQEGKAPKFTADILRQIGPGLHWFWPEKFADPGWNDDRGFDAGQFSVTELQEVLRAAEIFVKDFVAGTPEPGLKWMSDLKPRFDKAYMEFVRLLRAEIEARKAAGAKNSYYQE